MNKTLLNSMIRRRMSCPQVVQQLWDAVKVIRYQRQVPNLGRIAKYMNRAHTVTEEEVIRQLGYCVRDNLIQVTKRKSSKGAKVGMEQEGYKLPENQAERDKHDWYCFECHTAGDVVPCGACHRVYHLSCISNLPGPKQKFHCSVCQGIQSDETLPNIKQSTLNRLVTMVCYILRDRYSELVSSSKYLHRSIKLGAPGAQIDIGAESWRLPFLVHKCIDISRMINKAKQGGYTKLSQFYADAATIVHNVVIFHGVHSNVADTARQMARDCLSEVNQIRVCHTCYQVVNSKGLRPRRKFTAPCRPPHELVYVKSKGAPYWPAKVIKDQGDKLDIQFFGGSHHQTTVERSSVTPISININLLVGKRSNSWNRACDELRKHQELVRRLEEGTYESAASSDSDESVKSEKSAKSEKSVKSDKSNKSEKSCKSEKSLKSESIKSEKSSVQSETLKEKTPPLKRSIPKRKRASSGESDDSDNETLEELLDKKKVEASNKKRRGRPPNPNKPPATSTPKRKRGRPPKKKESFDIKPGKDDEKDDQEETLNFMTEKDDSGDDMLKSEVDTRNSRVKKSPISSKDEEEIVSSTFMEPQVRSCGTQTKNDSKKEKANKELIAKLKEEIEELKTAHTEELKSIKERNSQEIASAKKKQWCYNCEQEAIYHCCWNTAYCSTECQQLHWQREHKRVCRRKR